MDNEIIVSVAMITYNHGKYIEQALDSVLRQKVNFRYEIVLGDDCSPDITQDIVEKYSEKYPEIIVPILRGKNVGAPANFYDVNKTCKGKYIAILEGDDFWIDEYKLQKQVDFLEKNNQCIAVAHRHEIVDMKGIHQDYSHKNIKLNRFFNKKEAIKYKAALFHINSVMYKNFILGSENKYDIIMSSNSFSVHSLLVLLLATMSDIYIFDEPMSAWRMVVTPEGTNYTSVVTRDPLRNHINQLKMYSNYRKYFGKEYQFDPEVQEKFLFSIYQIIKSNYKITEKHKIIRELGSLLQLKDMIMMPQRVLMILYRRGKIRNE